jgi:5-methylcytosine-specific restriction enzyme B
VDGKSESLADLVREYVLYDTIVPARRAGRIEVTVRAGDVHAAMHLKDRMPAVCGALDAEKFLDLAQVNLVARSGPHQGANAQWVFRLA